jgi:hemerythrin-like domain-containing protein
MIRGRTKDTADDLPAESEAMCSAPDPIALVQEEHSLQLELCDLLEAIADRLPSEFDHALAVIAIGILQGSMPAHMRFEEEALFPLLRRRLPSDHAVVLALTCLEDEHARDAGIISELTDALKSAIAEGTVEDPETLGYVLRGFFESQRRHIAWEDRVVLPAAMAVLRQGDLAELQMWIMRSDHPRCSRQSLLAVRAARSGQLLCKSCPSGAPKSETETSIAINDQEKK